MATSDHTQTVSISFFRYRGLNKVWGMMQMLFSRTPMRKMKGLQFFKPLGTGGGVGYSFWPDLRVYGMLAVWDSQEDATGFLNSGFFNRFGKKSEEQFTIFLKPLSSRGSWSGFNNWQFSEPAVDSPLICALTRATIRPGFLFKFWSMVSKVSDDHKEHPGLIFTKGIGEYPWIEQATFSIWENVSHLENFAGNTFHLVAIKEARKRNGFREEMFTRLRPCMAGGTWFGKNPLKDYLPEIPGFDQLSG